LLSAAIAIIWIFKVAGKRFAVPDDLVLPGFLVVAALAVDLIQYLLASLIWYFFYRSNENANVGEDVEINHPSYLTYPIIAAFCLKVALVLVAYFMIGRALLRMLNQV
jgi:hypothetical protein